MILRLGNFFSKLATFSAYSYFITPAIFCLVRKFMSSDTNFFPIVFCRRAITKSSCVFCSCYHAQMRWIPTILNFANVIYNFPRFVSITQKHRKLMSSYVLSLIRNSTISCFYSRSFPKPARLSDLGFFFQFIQVITIISRQFKNTFHTLPITMAL